MTDKLTQVNFNAPAGYSILELGCGENPHPQSTVRVDTRQLPHVHFTANFDEPLPIGDNDFNAVYSAFVIEHLSWPKVRQFIAEVLRILKPGGRVVIITANVEAQIEWIKDHPDGWNDKPAFESASELLFGTQNYPENTHKNYMSPGMAIQLFSEAGYDRVTTQPFGEAGTDMLIEAVKGNAPVPSAGTTNYSTQGRARMIGAINPVEVESSKNWKPVYTREQLFDRHYFDGGKKVGGYKNDKWGAYRDFPVHEITARHILARKPESVLELGAGRGYVLKRIQDAGLHGVGLEISKHCYMTRVANEIYQQDICVADWFGVVKSLTGESTAYQLDLCYSIAVLEHIPEEYLSHVIKEMHRTCKRGLHGVDFGGKDDGNDLTHCTLRDKSWWVEMFAKHAPGWPVEIVDKEELERGEFPQDVLKGDGKVKLNIGSWITMYHHGWHNLDIHNLQEYAQQNGYIYRQCDVRAGLPYDTGSVDLISCCHMFEHLTYAEGRKFLKDCRRVLKPDTGAMRIQVPDAMKLNTMYAEEDLVKQARCYPGESLSDFAEISEGVANAQSDAERLWELLHAGHQSCYDEESLVKELQAAGFEACEAHFRNWSIAREGCKQLIREGMDCLPCLTLYVDAIPAVG